MPPKPRARRAAKPAASEPPTLASAPAAPASAATAGGSDDQATGSPHRLVRESLARLRVAELRGKLLERRLPTSGRKAELVERLLKADAAANEPSQPSTAESVGSQAPAEAKSAMDDEGGQEGSREKGKGHNKDDGGAKDDDAVARVAAATANSNLKKKNGKRQRGKGGKVSKDSKDSEDSPVSEDPVGASACSDSSSIDELVNSAFASFTSGFKQAQRAQPNPKRFGARSLPQATGSATLSELSTALSASILEEHMAGSLLHGVEKSSVLQPLRKKKVAPPKFTDFKATQVTEEVRHDVEVLRLRTFLDPKKHYKGGDHKWNPKQFQVGTVVVPPHEYYSAGRLSKKERKRGALAALQSDAGLLAYTKRKFNEVQENKAAGGRKHYKSMQKKKRPKWART